MLPTYLQRAFSNPVRVLTCVSMATALAACGGGGGSPGKTNITTPGTTPTTPGTTNPTTPTTPVVLEPKLTMQLVDSGGVAITSVSGGQTGQVRVTVLDAAGNVARNEVVKFTADQEIIQFTPESGTALTDGSGVATISIKPTTVTSAGAVKVTAAVVTGGKTGTSTLNLAVGAAPLTVGDLDFAPKLSVPPVALAPFGTAVLQFKVTTAGQPASVVSGLTLNSLCAGDGTATLVAGPLAPDGMQSVTYTNKGCTRGTDTISVAIGSSARTIQIPVGAANIGNIQFVGSDLKDSSIVLRGSGGLGRKESAILTFRVVDQNNNGLAGVDVAFTSTTNTGGLTVLPAKATSDANGNVSTTVSSGNIPTPVRVVAEAKRNNLTINGLSDSVIISTGLPIKRSMSISADKFNIEGGERDGQVSKITIRLADQYGNPISDDTAVNFVTEGGAVATSSQGGCKTVNGGCTVELVSQNFRPKDGRVTVMAYVQGLEDFTDLNGDGQYSCTSFTRPQGDTSSGLFRPLIDICAANAGEPKEDLGDPFLDTNPADGAYNPGAGDRPIPYNRDVYSANGNGQWGLNYISRSLEIVFSNSKAKIVRQKLVDGNLTDDNSDSSRVIAGLSGTSCSPQQLFFRIADTNENPLPVDSAITVESDKVSTQSLAPTKVENTTARGGTLHSVLVKPDSTCAPGTLSILVKTPLGSETIARFTTGS